MHELSLCRSIYTIVERAAGGRELRAVHLQVGQLRQVVPQTLAYCWGLVTDDTALAGAVLDIDHVPVVLDCRGCGSRTAVEHALVLMCATCAGGDITVLTGEEFMVTSVDLGPVLVATPFHPSSEHEER